MSLEVWGDENPDYTDYETWADRARDAGWFDPEDFSKGAIDILKERERQETTEGWTPEHDDEHDDGSLSGAAAAYAINASCMIYGPNGTPIEDPSTFGFMWDLKWWKPRSPREDLVRAGALIAAEIDRLDRAAAASTK